MLRSFDELNYRQEPRFHLELGLLKLVHTQRLIPLEQLMSQLPGGVSGGANASRPSAAPPRATASASPVPRPAAPQAAPPPPAPPSASPAPRPAAPQAAPPRSVVSSEAARGGSVTTSTPAQPSQPTFSPFESDTRRKSGPSGFAVASESASTSLTVGALAVDTAVADSAIRLHDSPPASDADEASQDLQHHEPPDKQIHGHATP